MKNLFTAVLPVATIVFLGGCMSPPMTPQSSSASGMAMSEGDMKMSCEKHMKMMASKTPSEQKAMMAIHTADMSPDMRDSYMKQMAACK